MRVTDYLRGHPDRLESVYQRIKKFTNTDGECYEWTGEMRDGYPVIAVRLDGQRRRFPVHRVVWERARGKTKLTIDHACRNRLCLRLKLGHLEAVTNSENVRRANAARHGSEPGRRCKNGHVGQYARDRQGKLYCKGCHRDAAALRRAKSKTAS